MLTETAAADQARAWRSRTPSPSYPRPLSVIPALRRGYLAVTSTNPPPHPRPFRRTHAPSVVPAQAGTHAITQASYPPPPPDGPPPTHCNPQHTPSLAKSPHTRSNTAHEFPTDLPTPTPRNRRHRPPNRPDLPADPEIPADQNRSKSIKIDQNRSGSIRIDQDRSQSITIDHNRSQSNTVEQDRTPSNTPRPSRPDMDPPQTPRNVENLRLPDQPRRRSAQTSTGNAIAGSSILTETASAADQARAWRRRASNSGPESSATRTN